MDEEKAELRILGQRHVAIDVEALCQHLDSLVGVKVAEVIMDNHQFRLGKEDAAHIRGERPQATVQEILGAIMEADRASGAGATKITLPTSTADDIYLEISNPAVKETAGAAKAFVFSYWSGALSYLLNKQFEARDVRYDQSSNLLKGRIVAKTTRTMD